MRSPTLPGAHVYSADLNLHGDVYPVPAAVPFEDRSEDHLCRWATVSANVTRVSTLELGVF